MVTELLVPRPRIVVPKLPSYVKLDMAFGVGAGTKLYDKSRYRAYGAITGANWATGLHGKCLDFDPTIPSYVEIPATETQLNFTSEDFSIVARLKVDDLTVNRIVFCRGFYAADGYFLRIDDDGEVDLFTSQTGAHQLTYAAPGTISVATWYTVGVSRDGAALKIYRNGVDVTTYSDPIINPATCSRTAKIGIYNNLTYWPFDGKMEFLRIFGGIALSTSEHLAWHNALA